MKRMMFVFAMTLAACGSKDSDKGGDPGTAKAKPSGKATVSLTVTGVLERKLTGPIGTCTVPEVGGKPTGAAFTADDGEYELKVTAATDADLAKATVFLHKHGQRQGYELIAAPTTLTLVPGKSVEVDTDLKMTNAIEGDIHLKGTITCD